MTTLATIDLQGPECTDDDLERVRRAVGRAPRDGVDGMVIAVHGDVADPEPSPDPEQRALRASSVVAPVIDALVSTNVPVVAHASGRLLGVPAALVLAADVAVMASTAVLVPFPATSPPAPGTGWLLQRAGVSRARAAALALQGAELTAQAAQDLGLTTQVAEDPAAASATWMTGPDAHVRLRAAVGRPPRDLAAAFHYDVQLAALWPT